MEDVISVQIIKDDDVFHTVAALRTLHLEFDIKKRYVTEDQDVAIGVAQYELTIYANKDLRKRLE